MGKSKKFAKNDTSGKPLNIIIDKGKDAVCDANKTDKTEENSSGIKDNTLFIGGAKTKIERHTVNDKIKPAEYKSVAFISITIIADSERAFNPSCFCPNSLLSIMQVHIIVALSDDGENPHK